MIHNFIMHVICPFVYALQTERSQGYSNGRDYQFDASCSDGGRVCIYREMASLEKFEK